MEIRTPLRPPDGWIRTRPQDQESRGAWKKTFGHYALQLEKELKHLKVVEFKITRNPEGDRDPGVSVWFSKKKEEDYTWQDKLGIVNPYPEKEEIRSAYRKLAAKYHPDNLDTRDIELFRETELAYQKAMVWLERRGGQSFDYAIGSDTFKEPRWNLAAIAGTLQALRRIETFGTSALMEKSLQGFAQLPDKKEAHVPVTA